MRRTGQKSVESGGRLETWTLYGAARTWMEDITPSVPEFFAILAKIYCPRLGTLDTNELYMHCNLDTFFLIKA